MSQSLNLLRNIFHTFDVTTNYYYRNPENRDKILSGGNEMRPSKKEGKYKVFTFADRHREREVNMKAFKEKIDKYPIIDEVKVSIFLMWIQSILKSINHYLMIIESSLGSKSIFDV